MRLTQWTDYSLRVLMYCACAADREAPVTIAEIADAHGISRAHLTKIVMTLAELGLLKTTRGRGGGLKLQRPASEIVIGDVLRMTEKDMNLVECFDGEINTCRIDRGCLLKTVLRRGLAKFLAELDGVTLADVAGGSACKNGTPVLVPAAIPVRRARRKA